jgi:hypothetical protein
VRQIPVESQPCCRSRSVFTSPALAGDRGGHQKLDHASGPDHRGNRKRDDHVAVLGAEGPTLQA